MKLLDKLSEKELEEQVLIFAKLSASEQIKLAKSYPHKVMEMYWFLEGFFTYSMRKDL